MDTKRVCVNCKGEEFVESSSYPTFHECKNCSFLIDLRTRDEKRAAGLKIPTDPMDDLMCESCQ